MNELQVVFHLPMAEVLFHIDDSWKPVIKQICDECCHVYVSDQQSNAIKKQTNNDNKWWHVILCDAGGHQTRSMLNSVEEDLQAKRNISLAISSNSKNR
jgi:hypothetical protein